MGAKKEKKKEAEYSARNAVPSADNDPRGRDLFFFPVDYFILILFVTSTFTGSGQCRVRYAGE